MPSFAGGAATKTLKGPKKPPRKTKSESADDDKRGSGEGSFDYEAEKAKALAAMPGFVGGAG
eukprot:scaffold650039_cov37-Prasinocladus_malaysianus.AAC.1